MKQLLLVVTCLALWACSSGDDLPVDVDTSYVEHQLSFMEMQSGKHWVEVEYVRDMDHLLMLHETFKKVGYKHLLDYEYYLDMNPCLLFGYVNHSLENLLDSLTLTYKQDSIDTKYYTEFWQRREKEGNDFAVYKVLKEVKAIYMEGKEERIAINISQVNDTLLQLLTMEYVDEINDATALQHFNYLVAIGLHQSAYNLLYERAAYQYINWDREALRQQLIESDEGEWVWFGDNTK